MKVIIVRHGKTDGNTSRLIDGKSNKAKLNKEGTKHSNQLMKLFKKEKIDFIFSSPSDRAVNTIKILSDSLKRSIKKDSRLMEIDFGKLDRRPVEENKEFLQKAKTDLNFKFPKGESYNDVFKRAKSFVKEVSSKRLKNIIIMGHHKINSALLAAFLSRDLKVPINYSKIAQPNEIVYIVDTETKKCSWINTLSKERGNELIYNK